MHRISLIIPLLLLFPAILGATEHKPFDPIRAYGDRIEFEVLRDGDIVGRHQVNFFPMDDGLQVDAELNLDIRFLGLTVYRFGYRSGSLWQNGRMVELNAVTDDDGEENRVRAVVKGDMMDISGPAGDQMGPAGLYPTDHWNPSVRQSAMVVNTITGQLANVAIKAVGVETVRTGEATRMATRYTYSGDLHDVEVWYDNRGRWVRLRFPDKSGAVIDYRCIRCGVEGTAER